MLTFYIVPMEIPVDQSGHKQQFVNNEVFGDLSLYNWKNIEEISRHTFYFGDKEK